MATDSGLTERLDEGTYVVDAHAVAEALLSRCRDLLLAAEISGVLVSEAKMDRGSDGETSAPGRPNGNDFGPQGLQAGAG